MNEKVTAVPVTSDGQELALQNDPAKVDNSAQASPKSAAHQVVNATIAGSKAVTDAISDGARATGRVAKEAAVLVSDLNDDGKVDKEDAKIAVAETRSMVKSIAGHGMVRDAAAGAAIGALIAIPVPVIGPAIGAALGAAVGVLKSITSRNR